MGPNYWHKQTPEKPLFPDILWSRPEHKQSAGKLLIIGGNLHSFAGPAAAYEVAIKSGVGQVKVLLPASLEKLLHSLDAAVFTASNASGGFAQHALVDWLSLADWANGVLLAGDFGRNSETAVVLEKFLEKYKGLLTLVGDSLEPLLGNQQNLLARARTAVAPNLTQLQKIALPKTVFKHDAQLLPYIDKMHEFSSETQLMLLTRHEAQSVVAGRGEVSTTPGSASLTEIAARGCVFWLQNPTKPFEALTSAMI